MDEIELDYELNEGYGVDFTGSLSKVMLEFLYDNGLINDSILEQSKEIQKDLLNLMHMNLWESVITKVDHLNHEIHTKWSKEELECLRREGVSKKGIQT